MSHTDGAMRRFVLMAAAWAVGGGLLAGGAVRGEENVAAPTPAEREAQILELRKTIAWLGEAGRGAEAEAALEKLREAQQSLRSEVIDARIAALERQQAEIDRLRELADAPGRWRVRMRWVKVDHLLIPEAVKAKFPAIVPEEREELGNSIYDWTAPGPGFELLLKDLVESGAAHIAGDQTVSVPDNQSFHVKATSLAAGTLGTTSARIAGTSLTVTPRSVGGGRVVVSFDTRVERTDYGWIDADGNPTVDLTSGTSSLVLEDGATMVVGGFQTRSTNQLPDGSTSEKWTELLGLVTLTSINDPSKTILDVETFLDPAAFGENQ